MIEHLEESKKQIIHLWIGGLDFPVQHGSFDLADDWCYWTGDNGDYFEAPVAQIQAIKVWQ